MPPQKKTEADTDAAAGGEIKFSWTPENDRTLLILALGRTTGPADYEKFVSTLPGANFQGVRQRISKLRGEQKKKYEEMGWELTAEASVKAKTATKEQGEGKAKGKAPAKRKGGPDADEAGNADSETAEPKAKKSRAKKGEGKKGAAVKEEVEGDEGDEAVAKEEGDEEAA